MYPAPDDLLTLGNKALLRLHKTAFLCSRDYPSAIEKPVYLWALEQRYEGTCVLSGFHSRLEQAVLRYLLQGQWHPVVYALGRGIQPSTRFEYEVPVAAGHLLFVTPFADDVHSITPDTAAIRNQLVAELADSFFIPYLTPGGNLNELLQHPAFGAKPIVTLDLPENYPLKALGAKIFRSALALSHNQQ
ncbi:DNA-binding protein [Hymenobacter oligotrophus]|uniref:DNA-binding protein n=2 Tax=Hymenobacter oligotrophus TaxID=2319843 RepID=A0A3B7R0R6_9BACT|nr:DNA-binding protein [Hymenobacter oligotrophus]